MPVLVTLAEAKHLVTYLETLGPDSSFVIASQGLLVPGRMQQGYISSFFELVQGIFSVDLIVLLMVCF